MSQEEAAFLRAILDSPTDDANRLVYADWLEERDDPRADLIRTQLEWEEAVRQQSMLDDWHWAACRRSLSDAGDWGTMRSWLLEVLRDLPWVTGEGPDASDGEDLAAEHEDEWAAGVTRLVEEHAFRRGLLERVQVTL